MDHCKFIVAWIVAISLTPVWGETYDPLKLDQSSQSSTVDLTIHDGTRDREIPIKGYLPAATTPAPVILFSHGLGGSRDGGSVHLGQHWSAKGYIVVSMQHHGSDSAVWNKVPLRQRLDSMRKAASMENALARYEDVAAVLDQLERWNDDSTSPLHHRLDLEHVGMSGHSFGAVTTEGVSGRSAPLIGQRYTDKRIDAAVMFSPSNHGRIDPKEAFANVSIPWMLMTGTKDTSPINNTSVADRRQVYPALPITIDKYELVLHDAEHSAFSDHSLRRRTTDRNPNHHRVILALTTAFWDAYLRSDANARQWLQGDQAGEIMETEDLWQFNASSSQ
jgi:predicted dienelactone hydrolase